MWTEVIAWAAFFVITFTASKRAPSSSLLPELAHLLGFLRASLHFFCVPFL